MNLYAFNDKNDLIHISEVEKKHKEKYFCCSCSDEMIAKKGDIKADHFAHKPDAVCYYESYLHKVSKIKFYKEYNFCLKNKTPFYIEYKTRVFCDTCQNIEKLNLSCKNVHIKPYDITKRFDKISMEKSYKGFIADILLESSLHPDEKIFIEFAVTHKCELEKLNSKIRIIEIDLVNEKNLKFISNRKIPINKDYTDKEKIQDSIALDFFGDNITGNSSQINNSVTQHKITYHNFKINEEPFTKYKPETCNQKISTFIINTNNKALRKDFEMKNLINHINSNSFKHIKVLGPKKSELTKIDECDFSEIEYDNAYDYQNSVIEAAFEFNDFKNCYSCRFSAKNNNRNISEAYGNVLICKAMKKVVENSNEGNNCERYWRIEKP